MTRPGRVRCARCVGRPLTPTMLVRPVRCGAATEALLVVLLRLNAAVEERHSCALDDAAARLALRLPGELVHDTTKGSHILHLIRKLHIGPAKVRQSTAQRRQLHGEQDHRQPHACISVH